MSAMIEYTQFCGWKTFRWKFRLCRRERRIYVRISLWCGSAQVTIVNFASYLEKNDLTLQYSRFGKLRIYFEQLLEIHKVVFCFSREEYTTQPVEIRIVWAGSASTRCGLAWWLCRREVFTLQVGDRARLGCLLRRTGESKPQTLPINDNHVRITSYNRQSTKFVECITHSDSPLSFYDSGAPVRIS